MDIKQKIAHDYVCDICGKPAVFHIQEVYHSYEIQPNGDFNELDACEGNCNDFRCKEHEDD
jgi:hypothetical protein